MKPGSSISRSCWLLALVLWATIVGAAENEDTLGTHVVQPGESLRSITASYLGDDLLWRENWRLNPEIDNPNLLIPGQELTVITERRIQADQAAVLVVSNRVDKNLQRTAWVPAEGGDQLADSDGLRTLEDSSAELRFSEASLVRLSEYSQVFLEATASDRRGQEKGRIEVQEGAADLIFEPMVRRRSPEVELVAGPAVARPRPDADGNAQVRAAHDPESGETRFMAYTGESTVTAGGQAVEIQPGEGTTIDVDGRPTAPEALLRAPGKLSPGDGDDWQVANQRLSWSAVGGAADYVVEVCRDAACGELVQRQAGIREARWEPLLDEPGTYFWRVLAVSPTGLEGFPSAPARFSLGTTVVSEGPPVVTIVPLGTARAQSSAAVLLSPDTRFRFLVRDEGLGVERVEYRSGDGPWTAWDGDDLPMSAFPDGHLEVRAVDSLGQWSVPVSLEWRVLP